jgi:hypothetical protein
MGDVRLQAKRDVVQIPLYSTEEAYQAPYNSLNRQSSDRQVLVNMFPVISKDPVRPDEGQMRLLSRPAFNNPNTGNSDLNTHLTVGKSAPIAVLGMRSTATEVIIAAYPDYSAPNYFLRIIQYRPGVSNILIGSINLTTLGMTTLECVCHLSEISHLGAPALAITVHPARAKSTASNSDGFYAVTTAGYFTAASLQTITDADFPTNATYTKGITGPIIQLNNVHYVMTSDGFISGSYPQDTGLLYPDIATWNTYGITTASQDPDGGVALVRYKHHLIAFGTGSMEFFNDEGQAKPALPILRTQQAYTKVGLANSKAWCIIDDDLYWIGNSMDTGSLGLYRMSGYTPELISSVPHSHQMSTGARYWAELYPFYTMGTTHIVTNWEAYPNIDATGSMGTEVPDNVSLFGSWVYCATSKTWWVLAFEFTEWQGGGFSIGLDCPQIRIAVTSSSTGTNRWIWVIGDDAVDTIGMHPCKLSEGYEAYGGSLDTFRESNSGVSLSYRIPVAVRTNRLQFNSLNRKTIHKMKIQCMYPSTRSTLLTTEAYNIYVQVWKDLEIDKWDDAANAPSVTRVLDLEQTAYNPFLTMYNFGTARNYTLQILASLTENLELGHLETTLSLADH